MLGVNLGRLGFLAALQPEQLDSVLPEIVAGRHRVVEHLMFECTATARRQAALPGAGAERGGSASRAAVRDRRRAALR